MSSKRYLYCVVILIITLVAVAVSGYGTSPPPPPPPPVAVNFRGTVLSATAQLAGEMLEVRVEEALSGPLGTGFTLLVIWTIPALVNCPDGPAAVDKVSVGDRVEVSGWISPPPPSSSARIHAEDLEGGIVVVDCQPTYIKKASEPTPTPPPGPPPPPSAPPTGLTIRSNTQRCNHGKGTKLLTLRNKSGSPITISAVTPSVGSNWSSDFTLQHGLGTVKNNGTATIKARGSCSGNNLSLDIKLSSGAVLAAGLNPSSQSAVQPLEANLQGSFLTVRAQELDVQKISVQVVSLSGQKMLEAQAPGNRLTTLARDSSGRPLANGVYLVVVTVQRPDGMVYSQIKKVVLVR